MLGIGPWEIALLLLFVVVPVAAMWGLFEKAGQSGWWALVPYYNIVLLFRICKRSGWWVVLFLLPLASIVGWLILCMSVANAYGKGAGFAIGLFVLPWIFFPIAGFGDATYQHPRTARDLL